MGLAKPYSKSLPWTDETKHDQYYCIFDVRYKMGDGSCRIVFCFTTAGGCVALTELKDSLSLERLRQDPKIAGPICVE